MSTYRQEIQDMIREIAVINKSAEWLRDSADQKEKNVFNATRQALFNAEGYLRELDDSLSPDRANMELS
jgi:hypothetical protein